MKNDSPWFSFGKNWKNYEKLVDSDRVEAATKALQMVLGLGSLLDKSFLDVGSGSGIHSLAAAQIGADVTSFDYDPHSVECTQKIKQRFLNSNQTWKILQGDILNQDFVKQLGHFDVVYSWGVLHHTGDMWRALENVALLCKPSGILCLAIYNDQGIISSFWRVVKKTYNRSGSFIRSFLVLFFGLFFEARRMLGRLLRGTNPFSRASSNARSKDRGMSVFYDLVDWIGGYPFEVAKPEQIFNFFRERGYELLALKTCGGGHGCCEYTFRKLG